MCAGVQTETGKKEQRSARRARRSSLSDDLKSVLFTNDEEL